MLFMHLTIIFNLHTYVCDSLSLSIYIYIYIYMYMNIYVCIHIYIYMHDTCFLFSTRAAAVVVASRMSSEEFTHGFY